MDFSLLLRRLSEKVKDAGYTKMVGNGNRVTVDGPEKKERAAICCR